MVSILIRTFNRPELLKSALLSVVQQDYRPLEVVVVNDGGEPVSEIVSEVLASSDITHTYKEFSLSKGRSAAANEALKSASGAFFLFLDDDDWILPNHVSKLAKALSESNTLIATYSDTDCVLRSQPEVATKTFASEYDSLRLSYENYLPIHSVLFRSSVVDAGCLFDVELSLYEDWHFWIQVSCLGEMQRVPGVSAYYSMDESGVGGQQNKNFFQERILFLRKAMPFMSDEQILYMNHSAVALKTANECVTSLTIDRDEKSLLIARQQYHLDQWEMNDVTRSTAFEKQKDLLVGPSGELERLVRLSQQQGADINQLKAALESHKEETQALSSFIENLVNRQELNINALQSQVRMLDRRIINTAVLRTVFSKVLRKTKTFGRLIKARDWSGIKDQVVTNTQRFRKQPETVSAAVAAVESGATIYILTTSHTLYIAELITRAFHSFGMERVVTLDVNCESFQDGLHVVICPQMFKVLPSSYIAFQMEQSVSSRWFDANYFQTLENSIAIMDYSLKNIEYLQETGGLSYRQIYYTPVSNTENLKGGTSRSECEYDIAFYGDINNERRKKFIDKLSEHYSILVVSNTFGEELYSQLRRAALVVNIHYYEGALLETTRIHECLSLGIPVVSEASSDMSEHEPLSGWVKFTGIGNIEEMISVVEEELAKIRDGFDPLQDLPTDLYRFNYYFGRMLVSLSLLDIEKFDQVAGLFKPSELDGGVALSLPETFDRYQTFREGFPSKKIFHGLRHFEGWKGCALSYRYLSRQALTLGMIDLEVWEDDVLLENGALNEWQSAIAYFRQNNKRFDVLCGLIADVSDDTQILDVLKVEGKTYVVIDRMVSTVCNLYGKKVLELLSRWDLNNKDVHSNTIDRYLQQYSLQILVPIPFIAGHRPEQTSTLWGFSNSTYDELIIESEKKLQKKVDLYLQQKALNSIETEATLD